MADKDKGIIEKAIETVEELASEVSAAAKHVMDPEPIKPGEQVVMLPSMNSGMFGEPVLPAFVIIPRRRKSRAKKMEKTPVGNQKRGEEISKEEKSCENVEGGKSQKGYFKKEIQQESCQEKEGKELMGSARCMLYRCEMKRMRLLK
jgi:hypothetical protein